MEKLLDLEELGGRLQRVDLMIMMLLKRRIDLAHLVARYKIKNGQKFIRLEIENERLNEVGDWAKKNGLDPNFARQMLYAAISESCKQQLVDLESRADASGQTETMTEEEEYLRLKQNLMRLTDAWAPKYDAEYDRPFFATRTYLEYERVVLDKEISLLRERDRAVDLGCATGRLTFQFADRFYQTVGYDLSQAMVERATTKLDERGTPTGLISFRQADLENGIPENDCSVSLVVMNMGTGSDVRNIANVIKESGRILKPGGRFFFSFYNRDALVYQWDFLPWPTGLAANIDIHAHCLNVSMDDSVLPIYARPYAVEEAVNLFADSGLKILSATTYPAISSVLPSEFMEKQPSVQRSIVAIEKQLIDSGLGAYIIITGCKE